MKKFARNRAKLKQNGRVDISCNCCGSSSAIAEEGQGATQEIAGEFPDLQKGRITSSMLFYPVSGGLIDGKEAGPGI